MAKKQMLSERNRNPESPHKTKTTNSPKTTSKHIIKNRSRITEISNGYASSEETDDAIGHSSIMDSSAAEDGGVEQSSSSDEEEEEEEQPKSVRKRGKKDDAKSKGKKRSGKEEEELEEERESAMYTFPMRRISQIIKSDAPDLKISKEAVFLINKASEKFLQLFCKEAYACTFLDKKKHTAYNHLASVVSKRMRFEFLSDIVPEKVKAEDALAHVAEAEK